LYVDAGYIRTQLAVFAGRDGTTVDDLDLSVAAKILRHEMQRRRGCAVHRQRCYDGVADSGMTSQQRPAFAQRVVLWQERIGGGELCAPRQRAVDTLLVRDIVVDPLRGDIAEAVLVPGVRELVNSVPQVHVWGIVDPDELRSLATTVDFHTTAPARCRGSSGQSPRPDHPHPESRVP